MDITEKLKAELNDNQFDAAIHMENPVVVMAGAGSGKTHTLMNRVANLVENWVAPERILMLTFTNAAADEMKARSSKLLDNRCEGIMACTYHKFCNLMLRKYGKVIDMQNYSILSPSDNKNLIDYVRSSNSKYNEYMNFPSSKTTMAIFSKSVNCMQSIEQTLLSNSSWTKYIDYVDELEALKEEVSEYCRQVQKYTYDDLLVYMNTLLDIDEFAEKIAHLFDYIMVDEFQDTNNLQEQILTKISKYNPNIMVVGDISQSIYAFRGANVRNLQNFNTKLPNCKTIVLNENYRSTQEILDFANEVMQNNVSTWNYYDMKSAEDKHGHKPMLIRPLDEFNQTEKVMELIEHYHNKGVPYSEMAVIERGSMSSFGIETELTKNGISFEKRGGMKLMDYDCVGDMLAYLTLVVKPYDLLSWFRVLKVHPYIGDVTAKKIADTCKKSNFLIDKKYAKNKYYAELDDLDTHYTVFANEHNLQKVFDLITDFYFEVRNRAVVNSRMNHDNRITALENIERDKTILEQLKNMTTKYTKISDFLDDLVLDSVSETEDEEDKLIITTIHSAKGLEWKIVFLIDCVDGSLPAFITTTEQYGSEEDEEELRCFYVAITRAKEELYLLSPKMKMKAGFLEPMRITHYLNRISDTLQFSV